VAWHLNNWRFRAICVAWGLASLLIAGHADIELMLVGFPDSHFTPYALQTFLLRRVLIGACALQGVGFLVLGIISKSTRIAALLAGIAVVAVLIVAPLIIVPRCWDFPGCARGYELIMGEPIDDGAGG
jgi:hypothetical protein